MANIITDLSGLSHQDVSRLRPDLLSGDQQEMLRDSLMNELVELAREDVNTFIALHFLAPQCEMHREWQRICSEEQRFLIAAPRGCGKSTQISTMRLLWEMGKNPGLRCKIVSVKTGRAAKFVQEIAKHIRECPQGVCQSVFPKLVRDYERSWSSEQINVIRPGHVLDTRDPSLEAWGVKSSPEGGRADILLFDDITSLENSVNKPKERDNIKRSFNGTWKDIKANPNAQFWYLCTLWHKQDCSHEIIANPGWNSHVFAIGEEFRHVDEMLHDKKFRLPIPSSEGEWNEETLRAEYIERGAINFNRSFRNRPATEGMVLFNPELIYGDEEERGGALLRGVAPWAKQFAKFPRFAGVDLGIGKKEGANNPSVIYTIAVSDGSVEGIPQGQRIVTDIKRGLWSSPETARMIVEAYEEWNHEIIFVESNYYQNALIEWIESMGNFGAIPLEPHVTGAHNKMNPEQGIPLLAAEFERGMWTIPALEDWVREDSKHPFNIWIHEMLNYYPGSKSGTDTVMACWMAQRAAKSYEGFGGGYVATWNM